MAKFRNDFGETRWLADGYRKVEPGEVLDVPDEDVVQWLTGEWAQVEGPRFHWDPQAKDDAGAWVPDEAPVETAIAGDVN